LATGRLIFSVFVCTLKTETESTLTTATSVPCALNWKNLMSALWDGERKREREEGKESNEEQGGSASGKRGGRGRETDPEARP